MEKEIKTRPKTDNLLLPKGAFSTFLKEPLLKKVNAGIFFVLIYLTLPCLGLLSAGKEDPGYSEDLSSDSFEWKSLRNYLRQMEAFNSSHFCRTPR